MEKLTKFQNRLQKDAAFQLDVLDCISEEIIQRAVNQEFLDAKSNGSLKDFLNQLKEKGLQKIQLMPRRKYGSSTKLAGATVNVDFISPTPQPQPTQAPQAPAYPNFGGLNGAANFGLGMPDILDGYAAKRENETLKKQIAELQADLKEEKESKRKWRDKAIEYQRASDINEVMSTVESKPSAFDKLLETIANNPATIPALVGAFKGGVPALNAPAAQEYSDMTEMQEALCDMISELPDEVCEQLAVIISRVQENDEAFIEHLKILIISPRKSLQKV